MSRKTWDVATVWKALAQEPLRAGEGEYCRGVVARRGSGKPLGTGTRRPRRVRVGAGDTPGPSLGSEHRSYPGDRANVGVAPPPTRGLLGRAAPVRSMAQEIQAGQSRFSLASDSPTPLGLLFPPRPSRAVGAGRLSAWLKDICLRPQSVHGRLPPSPGGGAGGDTALARTLPNVYRHYFSFRKGGTLANFHIGRPLGQWARSYPTSAC